MSTVVQTTYRPQIQPWVAGMVLDEFAYSIETRQVETVAGIGFGLAVSQGTGDDGCIIGGTNFVGVTVRDVTLDRVPINPLSTLSSESVPVDTYVQRANAGVLSRGRIGVLAGADVAAGQPVYYNTTNGGFTNSASGQAAYGSVAYTNQPAANDTLTVNGTVWTWVAALTTGNQLLIGATLGDSIRMAATTLGASVDGNTSALAYAAYPPSPGGAGQGSGSNTLMYADKTVGTAGNSITVATTTTGATVSGTAGALAGGTAAATQVTGAVWKSSGLAGTVQIAAFGIQQ